MTELVALFAGTVVATVILLKVTAPARRRHRAECAGYEFVNTPLRDIRLGVGLAAGAGATSLAELYMASAEHEGALKLLAHRFNRLVPDDATPLDWLPHFARWGQDPAALGGVSNAIAGQAAEEAAIVHWNEALAGSGMHGELAASRTQEGYDLIFRNGDGSLADLRPQQVKSYGDVGDFLAKVHSDPQPHYTVNEELFAKLSESGKLEVLCGRGIQVTNGGWSHAELSEDAAKAVGGLSEAADLAEDVPLIAAIFFGKNVIGAVGDVSRGRASVREGAVEVAVSAGRLATGGGGGFLGGKLGAGIGTLIAPGIGTVIGGGVGIVLGAWASTSLWSALKDRWKYGEIRDALTAIGEAARRDLRDGSRLVRAVRAKVFRFQEAEAALEREWQLALRHDDQRDVRYYLTRSCWKSLQRRKLVLLTAATNVRAWMRSLVPSEGPPLLLGELVAATPALHRELAGVDTQLALYRDQAAKYPHHPWRFRSPSGDVLSTNDVLVTAAHDALQRADAMIPRVQPRLEHRWGRPLSVLAIGGTWCLAGLVAVRYWSDWLPLIQHASEVVRAWRW